MRENVSAAPSRWATPARSSACPTKPRSCAAAATSSPAVVDTRNRSPGEEGAEPAAPREAPPKDVLTPRRPEDHLRFALGTTAIRIARKRKGGRMKSTSLPKTSCTGSTNRRWITVASGSGMGVRDRASLWQVRQYRGLKPSPVPLTPSDDTGSESHGAQNEKTDRLRRLRRLSQSARGWRARPGSGRFARAERPRDLIDYRTSDDAGVPAERRASARPDGRLLHADRRRSVHLRSNRRRQRAERRLRDGRPAADRARHRCFPEGGRPAVLTTIFTGGLDNLAEAGVALLGGHAVQDAEISPAATPSPARCRQAIWSNTSAHAGDELFPSAKALGTGIISTAVKFDRAPATPTRPNPLDNDPEPGSGRNAADPAGRHRTRVHQTSPASASSGTRRKWRPRAAARSKSKPPPCRC